MSRDADSSLNDLLELARAESNQALGQLLERYRNYLLLLARVQISRQLQGKVDASDLVQETFLHAHRDFALFRGTTSEALGAWLRQILAARLGDLLRRYFGAKRRAIHLERDLAIELEQSSRVLDRSLVDPSASPSNKAAHREQAMVLADALGQLPPDYQEVLILHDLEEHDFPEVARRMGRSVEAVKKLWARALARLRRVMRGSHGSD